VVERRDDARQLPSKYLSIKRNARIFTSMTPAFSQSGTITGEGFRRIGPAVTTTCASRTAYSGDRQTVYSSLCASRHSSGRRFAASSRMSKGADMVEIFQDRRLNRPSTPHPRIVVLTAQATHSLRATFPTRGLPWHRSSFCQLRSVCPDAPSVRREPSHFVRDSHRASVLWQSEFLVWLRLLLRGCEFCPFSQQPTWIQRRTPSNTARLTC
jgi:hypothetical protein